MQAVLQLETSPNDGLSTHNLGCIKGGGAHDRNQAYGVSTVTAASKVAAQGRSEFSMQKLVDNYVHIQAIMNEHDTRYREEHKDGMSEAARQRLELPLRLAFNCSGTSMPLLARPLSAKFGVLEGARIDLREATFVPGFGHCLNNLNPVCCNARRAIMACVSKAGNGGMSVIALIFVVGSLARIPLATGCHESDETILWWDARNPPVTSIGVFGSRQWQV